MRHLTQIKRQGLIIAVLLLYVLAVPIYSQTSEKPEVPKSPEKGISIMLSVYSGRPNPQWWLTEDSTLRQFVDLIDSMKIETERLFDYDEWNRLGYASFWIEPKGMENLPKAIHIWRDMAYVIVNEKDKIGYAVNATDIYNLLVEQAEKRDHGRFFENYRKLQKEEQEE